MSTNSAIFFKVFLIASIPRFFAQMPWQLIPEPDPNTFDPAFFGFQFQQPVGFDGGPDPESVLPNFESVGPTGTSALGQGIDSNPLCCEWAAAGECLLNPFWMKPNCPKACGTPGATSKHN